jgi:DNA uptake protein ComE-like DNA-binding protein
MAPVCVVSQLIEKSKMQLTRLLAAVGLSLVLAAPVMMQTTSPSGPQSSPAATKPDAATSSQPSPGLVDINSASAEELRKLRGIGPMRVNAIIAHRPYSGKDDLVRRKIIPTYVYNRIKNKIIARQK